MEKVEKRRTACHSLKKWERESNPHCMGENSIALTVKLPHNSKQETTNEHSMALSDSTILSLKIVLLLHNFSQISPRNHRNSNNIPDLQASANSINARSSNRQYSLEEQPRAGYISLSCRNLNLQYLSIKICDRWSSDRRFIASAIYSSSC